MDVRLAWRGPTSHSGAVGSLQSQEDASRSEPLTEVQVRPRWRDEGEGSRTVPVGSTHRVDLSWSSTTNHGETRKSLRRVGVLKVTDEERGRCEDE